MTSLKWTVLLQGTSDSAALFSVCVWVCMFIVTSIYNNIYGQFLIPFNNPQNHHCGSFRSLILHVCSNAEWDLCGFLTFNCLSSFFSAPHSSTRTALERQRSLFLQLFLILKKTETIVPKNSNLGQSGNSVSQDGHAQPHTFKSSIFLSALTCVWVSHSGGYFHKFYPFIEQWMQNACSYFERTEKKLSGRVTHKKIFHSFPSSSSLCLLPHTHPLRLRQDLIDFF